MGLQKNTYNPCLYTSFICDPGDPSDSPALVPLTLGLYVDDFFFFSTSNSIESKFQRILSCLLTLNFMGVVEWFLGIHFSLCISNGKLDVHMNQSGFARNLVENFDLQHWTLTPNAKPCPSRILIDAVPKDDKDNDSPAQKRRTAAYQRITGSVGCLSNNTRPDLYTIHFFPSPYDMYPAPGHMKAALYVLHYIHFTYDYGISFSSRTQEPIHVYLHHPDVSDT